MYSLAETQRALNHSLCPKGSSEHTFLMSLSCKPQPVSQDPDGGQCGFIKRHVAAQILGTFKLISDKLGIVRSAE